MAMSALSNNTAPNLERPIQAQQSIAKGMHRVDAALVRLKQDVLPTTPYLLSTPTSLRPEHLKAFYPNNAISLKRYSLFRPGEEELQYLTFKDRSGDPDIHGLTTRGGWDDGKGRIAPLEESFSRTSSDGTPRQGHVPRKKISLTEYNNKERNKLAPATAPTTAPSLRGGGLQDNKHSVKSTKEKEASKPQQTEKHGQKRSAEIMTGQDPGTSVQPPSSPPAKKPRVEPKPSSTGAISKVKDHSQKPSIDPPKVKEPSHRPSIDPASANDKHDERREPRFEKKEAKNPVPTASAKSQKSQPSSNPPQSEKPKKSLIPPMLSPLSSVVEEEIAKMTAAVQASSPATGSRTAHNSPAIKPSKVERQATPDVRKSVNGRILEKSSATTKPPRSATPTKGPQEQKEAASNLHPPSKDAESKNVTTPKSTSNVLHHGTKSTSTPTPKTTPPDPPKRMRLRVSLKIKKKANRKQMIQYLNMKPTPGRNSLFPNRPIQQEHRPVVAVSEAKSNDDSPKIQNTIKRDPKTIRSEGPRIGEKRDRAQSDADDLETGPSSKRKPPGWIPQTQKPATPKPAPTSSPALSHLGSAQKLPASTPNAEASTTAMLRAASSQGSVQTPQQPTANGTPIAPESRRRRHSYTSPGKPKSDDLRDEGKEHIQKARTLKHDADVYLKKKESMTEDERKKGLVLGTESVLCFMMAFTFFDTMRRYSDRNAWDSALPYLAQLQEEAGKFRELKQISGLLSQIEAIIRDQIAYADMQILDKNPFEHDLGNPAENSSRSNESNDQRKAVEYNKKVAAFHGHFMKAQNAWRSGWLMLNVVDLPTQYPETWAKRDESRYAYGKGRDAVKKDEYIRKYNLPMNQMTSSLEAINFGMNFLAEWSKQTGVDWQPKLVLAPH